MPSQRPIEPRPFSRATLAACAVLLLVIPFLPLHGQRSVLVQGLLDAELWATDSASPLLTRNDGRPGGLARLQAWTAIEPWRGIVFFGQGQVEAGSARADEEQMEVYFDQFGIRAARSRAMVLEIGKMAMPVGGFASRRFSNRNPLIGTPDGYPIQYPYGAMLSGATDRVDYRIAAVTLPVSHEHYLPDPSQRLRPAVGLGVTPMAGVRLGASATWGPYLNDSLASALLDGKEWHSFRQRVVAADVQLSRGYLETHAEVARSSYDIPARSGPLTGLTYYIEAKYTMSPRLYVAARYERNDYPFMMQIGPSTWLARLTNLYDGEAGIGYRLSASRLLKLTYRADQWHVEPEARAFLRDGRAFAMQLSQAFDVGDVLR